MGMLDMASLHPHRQDLAFPSSGMGPGFGMWASQPFQHSMGCRSTGKQSCPCSIPALIPRDQTLSSQLSLWSCLAPPKSPSFPPGVLLGWDFPGGKSSHKHRDSFSPGTVAVSLLPTHQIPRILDDEPLGARRSRHGNSRGRGKGVWDGKRLFPPVGGSVRNNSSSFGLETSQFGRKRPFLPKLLAGKPRLGNSQHLWGSSGKSSLAGNV